MSKKNNVSQKVAIFYAFLTCQGGGERLMFTIRDYFKADFFTGGINSHIYNHNATNSFSSHLYNGVGSVQALHEDSKIPVWYVLKRLIFYAFSPVINQIAHTYDEVIISGNVSCVAWRLKREARKLGKKIHITAFVHTPPRKFTDQKGTVLRRFPVFMRNIVSRIMDFLLFWGYTREFRYIDTVFTNSRHIQDRLLQYCNVESKWIFPPVNLERFTYIDTADYIISYSRLEEAKRIRLVVEAFKQMPEQNLIICSTGPLKEWVQHAIEHEPHITYKGLVSDEELAELVGKCRAGITIPVYEDAGITQLEIMSASKPVIGVAEGGLLDTVIDGKTGVLIPSNPCVEDVVSAVRMITRERALEMKDACRAQAELFSYDAFFNAWEGYRNPHDIERA